jgi:MFS family permease
MHIFFIISFLTEFAGGLFYFTVPLLAIKAHASTLQLGILGSAGSFFYIPFAVFFGYISGRFANRQLPFYALCLIIADITVILFTHQVVALFAVVLINGFAFGAFWPPLMNQLNADTGGSGKIVGFFSFAWSIGTILGPVVAGYLFQKDPLLPVAASICVFIAVGITLFQWNRVCCQTTRTSSPLISSKPSWSKTIVSMYLGLFAVYFSFGAVRNLFPQLATILDISPLCLGVLFSLMDAFRTLTFFLFTRQESLFKKPLLFVYAGIIAYFSLSGIIFTDNRLLFALNFIVLGGIMVGVYYVFVLHEAFHLASGQALAVGIFEAVIGIGVGFGALLGGMSAKPFGIRGPYLLALIIGVIISLAQLFLLSMERNKDGN